MNTSASLNWHGLRVLNTRPADQAEELNQRIIAAGGIPVNLPALSIEPCDNDVLANLPNCQQINQAIFISSNAVRFFFNAIAAKKINWNSAITVSAVGHATAAELSTRGVTISCVPKIADSEHLIQLDNLQDIATQNIIIVKGEGGRDLIEKILLARGARVIPIIVYRRTLPKIDRRTTEALCQDDAIDIILFTSEQAIHNLFVLFGEQNHHWLRHKPCLVISQRLAEVARRIGIKTIYVSSDDDIVTSLRTKV